MKHKQLQKRMRDSAKGLFAQINAPKLEHFNARIYGIPNAFSFTQKHDFSIVYDRFRIN